MFVGDAATGAVRKVEAIGNRASSAAFSPDGKRLALARHSDFSVPGSKNDDTLFIVDVATLATLTLEPTTDHWPSTIQWSADGKALWVTMNFQMPAQWVTLPDLATGAPAKRASGLAKPPAELAPRSPLRRPIECDGRTVVADRWAPDLRVVDAADAGTVVAHLEGRERGFHDYMPDFREASWSPGCGYVIFRYDQRLWAVPANGSGGPGPIIEGSRIVFAP
jgi:dipeptidyl aminopeptidase/acylaminoacyl peptidase